MIKTITGDCREILGDLAENSFDCVVTSPPYYGLRDYGVAGQIGLEPTMAGYLDTMVGVCRQLRRVLKPGGTFWLNIGDSYNNFRVQMGPGQAVHGRDKLNGKPAEKSKTRGDRQFKEKDLMMIPNRLAIALQDDGWYVRSEIIWAKPNPMPESVTDRPTSAHEKIWLLTKGPRYFYDAEAIAEPAELGGESAGITRGRGRAAAMGRSPSGNEKPGAKYFNPAMRNARNVWTIASQPYRGAHFACFPPELVERCIKAGCPPGGHVLDPFGGAGTTGMVADRLGRHATLIDLNTKYIDMARDRIVDDAGMFAEFHP